MTEPSQHNHPRRNVWWNCRRRQARACENQPLEPGPPLSDAFFSFCKSFSRLSCFFSSSCNRHGNRHGWNHAAMPFVPPQKNMKRLPKSWRGWCLDQKKIWGFGQQWSRLLKARPKVPILILLHPILVLISEPVDINALEDIYPWPSSTNKKLATKMQKKNI
jgi:hypothetical protein